jgi:hypothetical protein
MVGKVSLVVVSSPWRANLSINYQRDENEEQYFFSTDEPVNASGFVDLLHTAAGVGRRG